MSFGGDPQGSEGFAGLRDVLARTRDLVEELVALDPAGLADAELAQDLVRLARLRDRLESVATVWSRAACVRGIGLADGHVSTPAWISWQTGQPRGAVNRMLRTAEVCELLPETAAAWAGGEITSGAVDLITSARVAGFDDELVACEDEFLTFARRRDHKSLRIATQHFAGCALADGTKPQPADGITLATVGRRMVVRGELHGGGAESVAAAIDAFAPAPTAEDGTTAAERRAAGLVRVCELAMGRSTDPGAEPARPSVSYLTHERVAGGPEPMTLGMFTGVIGPAERDRILCDCDRTEIVVDDDGLALDVGRSTRVWPTAIRKAIIARDGHCQWPGCDTPAVWCDAHHFVHWEAGGPTNVANGVLLCRRHHTFLHKHPAWRTTFDRQHFRVYRPDGTEVDPDPWRCDRPPPGADPGPDPPGHARAA